MRIGLVSDTHLILLVNPDTPTLPNHAMRLGTVGILEIQEGAAEALIIHLE